MSRPIVIAIMQGADPHWTIIASSLQHPVPFLGPRAAPLSFVEGILAPDAPTQVIVFDTTQNRVESSWFYDPVQGKRKLVVIGEANARDKRADPPALVICQVRKIGGDPRGWCVTGTDNPAPHGHDGCTDPEDALKWMRYNKSRDTMLVLVHRAEDDRIDKAYSVSGDTWVEVPLKIKHPGTEEERHLYPGLNTGATDRLPEAKPRSFRAVTIRPTGDRTEYAVVSDDGARTTRPDRETACVYAHSLGDQYATVFLIEHDRHDKPSAAFLYLNGTWAKLPGSVVRFLNKTDASKHGAG